jgi:hypothetical protein
MLAFKEALKKLEGSKDFMDYHIKNPKIYLSNAFIILDKAENDWELNYYSPKTEQITIFTIGAKIKLNTQKISNKEEPQQIEINRVELTLDEALDEFQKLKREKYPSETTQSIIVLLQKFNEKVVWNITTLTTSFKTLNAKINAENGTIAEETLKPLIQVI